MTVATVITSKSYTESAAANYTVPFKFLQATDLLVTREVGGIVVPLALGAGYTVSGAGSDGGGFITRITAAVVGAKLTIARRTPISSDFAPTETKEVSSEAMEAAVDKLTLIAQEQKTQLGLLADSGGSGGIGALTAPRYPGLQGGVPYPWSGMQIGASGDDELTDAGMRDMWIDWFYTSDNDTDSDALALFAANINIYGDCRLRFAAGKGRGPSGRYIIDRTIEFLTSVRVVLEFDEATVRFTTPDACIKYTPPQVIGSSSITPPSFFIVRGGVHQYAAAVEYMFWWNFPFIASRQMGTGYAENMRIIPQDNNNSGHSVIAPFLTCSTWYFSLNRCHVKGPARVAGVIIPDTCIVEQRGFCVECDFHQVEGGGNHDMVLKPGIAAMVGVEGSFTSGTYARGKALRQGGNIAYFGRNDGGYGWTYSLYDETGTLAVGSAELLDSAGTVVGAFTIDSIGRYSQCSEAVGVYGRSTFIETNYFANATSPDPLVSKFLNWGFHSMHMAYREGFLKLDGIADLQVGSGVFGICSVAGGKITFDINHGDMIKIDSGHYTTNALGGQFYKLQNIIGGHLSGNTIFFFEITSTTDNTVKDFKIEGNVGYLSAPFSNTGKRYNYTNTRGIRFYGNGNLGVNTDLDDNRRHPWVPVVTAAAGAITAYTVTDGWYVLCNGMLHYSVKIAVTNRGTATGVLYASAPAILDSAGVQIELPQHLARASSGTNIGCNVFYASVQNRFELHGPESNSTDDAFKQANVFGSFVYLIQGSVPVEYD